MKVIVKALDLIVAHLQTVLTNCQVRRAYIKMMDTKKFAAMKTPLVSVYPVGKTGKIISRDSKNATLTVEIDIEKKINGTEDEEKLLAEVDPLFDVSEIAFDAFLKPVELGNADFRVLCRRPVHDDDAPLYVPAWLEKNHFISVVIIDVEIEVKA